MSAFFTTDEIELLGYPHVSRAWFAELHMPDEVLRLHSGAGRCSVGGYEWNGVSDPVGGRTVSISGVREPAFGQAAAVTIVLSDADVAFFRSVRAARRDIEGREANIYWAAFDAETQQPVTGLIGLFTRGYMSAPAILRQGIGVRTVTLTIENIWSAKNFKPGGRWNGASQRDRYPGDKGLDFVGVSVNEAWQ